MKPNIHLIPGGGFVNGKIKFTPRVLGSGDEDGYDNTTSIEILRTYDGDNAGPGNIRFLGVGKSTKTATTSTDNGLPSNDSTGRGSTGSVGSHVMMFSDVNFVNKYGEAGKAYDYYEIIDKDMYVSSVSATMAGKSGGGGYPFVYSKYVLYPWGTSNSGWDNITTPGGYEQFQGSRTGVSLLNHQQPINVKIGNFTAFHTKPSLNPPVWTFPGIGDEPEHLNAWISPTSGVRFNPINLNQPSGGNRGLSWVDFNIDMGLIFEAVNNGDSNWLNGFPGFVYGLGAQTNLGLGVSSVKKDAFAKSTKVKHIKIILDSDKLGITSFLDNNDYTNRRNPLAPWTGDPGNFNNNSNNIGGGQYYTDWYVGQLKPMSNLTGLGESFNASASNLEGWENQWYDGDGVVKWNHISDSLGLVKPFQNDPTNLLTSEYPQISWGSIGDNTKWAAHIGSSLRNANQYGTFMWRIYTQYPAAGSLTAPLRSILEIYFAPSVANDQPDYNGGYYWRNFTDPRPGQSDDDAYGLPQSRGGFYPNIPIMLSKYVQFGPENDTIPFDLEAILTNAPRTNAFYKSHGFSCSGQAIVKWNRVASKWNSTAASDPENGPVIVAAT
jgi:hypothetical protein